MNKLYKVVLGLTTLMVTSCTKYEALEFSVIKPESATAQEDIDAYPALKSYINRTTYPNFKFGVALSLSDYVNKGVMYRLANKNFDEIVLGYEMKHGAVVQADGSLALDNVSKLLATAKDGGIAVYGHTLCWHANQNANYLKGVIAPLTVTAPSFPNDLNTSALQSGVLSGWNATNNGAGISVANNTGMGTGTKAIKLTATAGSSSATALQLVSPSINVVAGHKYEIVCYIKSDVAGEGRISFEGLTNNTPQVDWMKTGKASATFTTGISWKEVRFQVSDFTGTSIKLNFDLGYKPNVNYYIDVNNLYVYDTQGTAVVTNLVANGDFETGSGWGGYGGNSSRGITADGLGYNNKGKAFYVTMPAKTANYWDAQTALDLGKNLNNGESYNLSFWVKGTAEGIIRPELQSPSYASNGFGQIAVTKEWKLVDVSTTATAADRNKLVFSYGEFAGTVYIDNVVLKSSKATGGAITIAEKTAEEKSILVGGALDKWMSGMLAVSKPYVKAWDVVNEPMDDGKPYELKTGVGKTLATDEFYWQDYLGKDYAVTAFQLARKYGNASDILFINDYNLEYNLDKCRGLIAYVSYIEGKGAKVDGIGTQMHIDIKSDKTKIADMFKLLAATGKVIKISELDIGLGSVKTANATQAQYQAQAEMYKYVIDKYFELIPAAQRYGITLWSPLDSPANSSWRADEPIGLWTKDYVRKVAYSYVAESIKANMK
ncbi:MULTISPECIES: endo-1,4-beta-xylanase [unclassified Arcicella]|uniref:endo-1,4-beta-xylanase n=1 Tax=unclassified Arcicella TaxID=2644986 RepID=UPI0028559D06|nr:MULTISPECIES: endo-1,4-beta-xylanase [unclassified Arcicella]MDR6562190.1 GH35 family endo-1,4-beta-xylanase [Arcicella sp. BE51]MDR6812116.1 GH35 family endo-1,4-beta-xylanase [Arcicella sp. BE140]MDR6823427.1 GH35 family endo-1,4-beta-xylanase [Arcicella sp. BE139]